MSFKSGEVKKCLPFAIVLLPGRYFFFAGCYDETRTGLSFYLGLYESKAIKYFSNYCLALVNS